MNNHPAHFDLRYFYINCSVSNFFGLDIRLSNASLTLPLLNNISFNCYVIGIETPVLRASSKATLQQLYPSTVPTIFTAS